MHNEWIVPQSLSYLRKICIVLEMLFDSTKTIIRIQDDRFRTVRVYKIKMVCQRIGPGLPPTTKFDWHSELASTAPT